MTSLGREVFGLGFQVSPIVLTNGIASSLPGQLLPIVLLTQAVSFVQGILSGTDEATDINNYFAQFYPAPGSSLIDAKIGEYTFANQSTAANAIIINPLKVSMMMICPARGAGGFAAKLATLTALKLALNQHLNQGGTFTVVTPSYIYTNCVLLNIEDVSGGESGQKQTLWRWNFRQPLVSLADAEAAQNGLMSKLSSSLPTDGNTSGPLTQVGNLQNSATAAVIPAAQPLAGAGLSGLLTP